MELRKCIDSLSADIPFLDEGFKLAVQDYRKKFDNRSTREENLKSANWNVVEYQTLLQQAQELKGTYEVQLGYLNPAVPLDIQAIRTSLRGLVAQAKNYLCNLFKKKRTAATHVLVLMLSDEGGRGNHMPYPLDMCPTGVLETSMFEILLEMSKLQCKRKGLIL